MNIVGWKGCAESWGRPGSQAVQFLPGSDAGDGPFTYLASVFKCACYQFLCIYI